MAQVFSDSFVEASNTDLHLHTPNVGTSWSVLWQTTTADKYLVVASVDTISQAGNANSGAIYTADATYSSADYEVKATVATLGVSATASLYLFARIQDTANMYAYRHRGVSGVAGGGQIYKKVAGTWSALGASFVGATALDVVTLEVIGTAIRVLYNGVEQRSVTDSAITAAGKAGVGLAGGAELVTGADDPSTGIDLDDFEVNTLGAAADLVIQDGVHAHTADSQSLTQAHNLTIQESSHGHTSDTQALTQVHELAVADAGHGHAADSFPLTQVHNLAVADGSHVQAADNVVLVPEGALELEIADATHAHSADNVVLWTPVTRRSTSAVSRRSSTAVDRRELVATPRRGG